MTRRVAILISGGGSNMASLVESMCGAHPARPVLVLANVAGAGGLERAAALGVTTRVVENRKHGNDRESFERELHVTLAEFSADILCLAGFMRVLSAGFVARWQGRMLNIHPSLLPKYRGLDTHARALAAGDAQAGCTVHEVTATLDDGPILGQGRVPVLPGDTAATLGARVLEMEHRLYPAVLRHFAVGDRSPVWLP